MIVTVKGPICSVIRMASPPFGGCDQPPAVVQRPIKNSIAFGGTQAVSAVSATGGASALLHRHGDKNRGPVSPLFLPFPRKRLAASAAGGASALLHRHGDKNRGPVSPLFLPYPRKRLAASATGGASALSSCRCAAPRGRTDPLPPLGGSGFSRFRVLFCPFAAFSASGHCPPRGQAHGAGGGSAGDGRGCRTASTPPRR